MLGDRLTERGDHQAGGGRDVEGAGGVAAGAAGIHGGNVRGQGDVKGLLAHHAGQPGHLVYRLAAQAQGSEERAELRGGRYAGHDLFHRRGGITFAEGAASHQLGNRFADHRLPPVNCQIYRREHRAVENTVQYGIAHPVMAGWAASRMAEWNSPPAWAASRPTRSRTADG